ncbi:MAG: Gx transporter family protein [Lachnospiraceae bacterium]|nr:Gx transporter family protein [Lachnospiraceae bacterium]
MNRKTHQLALMGLLIALAFILSYIESLIPVPFFVPGMKLGLANLMVVTALYLLDIKAACVISLVRMLLIAFTFGNLFSLMYSLTGGVLSLLVMGLAKRSDRFSCFAVSALGGVAFNIGQLITAILVAENTAIVYYLPVLLVTGCVAGLAIGLLGGMIIARIRHIVR